MQASDRIELKSLRSKARLRSPLEGFAEVDSHTEYRVDPLTGRVAIVGLNLAGKRTVLYSETDQDLVDSIAEKTRAGCFFCPDKVETTTPRYPEDVLGEPEGRLSRGESILFPNLFPLTDFHAVVALGAEHCLRLDEFGPELIEDGLSLAVDFVRRVTRHEGSPRAFAICGNYLQPGGASIVHPHMQIVGSPQPLTTHAQELAAAERFHAAHGTCYFDDLVEAERAAGDRYVGRAEGPVDWLAAFAPRGNNEVHGVCRGARDVTDLEEGHIRGLAHGMSLALLAYHRMKLSTFNFCIYGAPVGEGTEAHGVYLSLVSRQSVVDNYRCDDYFLQKMLGTEILVDPPERVAELVRAEMGR